MATPRQSNMELLRIISMLMVLLVHIDGASLGLPDIGGNFSALDGPTAWQLAVESIAIVGVNCFTLISGYFGIRLSWRGMGSYLYQCLFYAVGISSVGLLVNPLRTTWTHWLDSWLILSHTDLWYVPAYFGLMLIAPILNRGVESLSRRDFGVSMLLFLVYNLWCGWWMGGKFNPTGYTLVQMILMYLIGRYIRLHVNIAALRRPGIALWTSYAVATAAIFAMALYMKPIKAFAYNSPAVIAASAALLMAFATLRFTSSTVNYVAKSAFAVYLLHKTPLVWTSIMKPTVLAMWRSDSLWLFTLKALAMVLTIYLAALIIDPLRRFIWRRLDRVGN